VCACVGDQTRPLCIDNGRPQEPKVWRARGALITGSSINTCCKIGLDGLTREAERINYNPLVRRVPNGDAMRAAATVTRPPREIAHTSDPPW